MPQLTQGKLSDHVKIDCAVKAQSLASTNATGEYHPMKDRKSALFVINANAMANAATVVGQVYQAQDAAATGAKAITNAAATITATTKMTSALLTGNTIVDTTTVFTLNGQLFTCIDTDPDIDSGEYISGSTDTDACVQLAAAINHLLPKLRAVASTSTVILTSREPGEEYITITGAHASIVPSGLTAVAYIEVDPASLDIDGGFTHVALKLTTVGTIVVGAHLLSEQRYSPVQKVAASKTDVAA
jgi:hypothetical protein